MAFSKREMAVCLSVASSDNIPLKNATFVFLLKLNLKKILKSILLNDIIKILKNYYKSILQKNITKNIIKKYY